MKKYTPARRAAVSVYVLLTILLAVMTLLILFFIPYLGKYDIYFAVVYWIAHAFFSIVLMPRYFKKSSMCVNHDSISLITGLFTTKSEFMPMDSVTSITTFMTPFSGVTGLNFISINALGSRIVFSFMKKEECIEATQYINDIISRRE